MSSPVQVGFVGPHGPEQGDHVVLGPPAATLSVNLGIPRVFALTYKEEFFRKCGFLTVAKDELPQKVWRECIDCPKFPNCEETAVLIDLRLDEGKDSL